jgi:hypothetical protein
MLHGTSHREPGTCDASTGNLPFAVKGALNLNMQNEESKLRYQAYLLSDYWQKVSEAVKAKAGYKCQICNSPHDLQAHHRSYEHRGRELEFIEDLTCLCRRCPGIFHGKTTAETHLAPTLSGPPQPEKVEMVWITAQNCKRLKCTKQQWHWMKDNGINPQKKGWAQRAIGWEVPRKWLR